MQVAPLCMMDVVRLSVLVVEMTATEELRQGYT